MKAKQWLAFLLLGAIWSSSFMWIKLAIQEMSPAAVVAVRVSLGLIFGLVVVRFRGVHWPSSVRGWMPLLVLGLSNMAIPFMLISWGEQTIDSGAAAVLDATVPFFTVILAHFVTKDDSITLPKLFGVGLGFLGVITLVSRDLFSGSSSLAGEFAVVLASVSYAGSAVYARLTTAKTPGLIRSTGPLISASAAMWLVVLITGTPVEVPKLQMTWFALLFLGIVGSGLAFVLLYYLIHEIGPTRTTMVTYIFPLGGLLLGVVALHEPFTWQLAGGAAMIVAGLVGANWSREAAAPKTGRVPASGPMVGRGADCGD